MNTAIEMHDSECLAVEVDGHGAGFLFLEAYVHRSQGEPGASPGEGGMQRIRISMGSVHVKGSLGSLPATIYEGSLAIGDSMQVNMVPFPASYGGEFQLRMRLAEDARVVVITGRGLTLSTDGPFVFLEPVDFSDCR